MKESRGNSSLERVMSAIAQPAYCIIALIVCIMGACWGLIEGTLTIYSDSIFIVNFLAFVLWSFILCGFVAWGAHAAIHHLIFSGQEVQPDTLIQAIKIGPWTPRRICGIILNPFYWCHSLHHHPDPKVSGSIKSKLCEWIATGILGGGYTIPLAIFAPNVMHLGAAIMFLVAYVTIHLFNFHSSWTNIHKLHHQDPNRNLSPNLGDILFATTDHIEDIWHQVPNAILGAVASLIIVVLCVKRVTL